MNWLKKRSSAVLVLLLAILLSVFLGGGGKLRQARAEAEDAFFHGTSGFSVYNDIMELREIGYNFTRIAQKGQGADAEQRALAAALALLEEAQTPEDYASACSALSTAADALDKAIQLDGENLDSWERQMRSFAEFASHLQFDSYYDQKADAYNRLLSDPLASVIGRLTGCGSMPRFHKDAGRS